MGLLPEAVVRNLTIDRMVLHEVGPKDEDFKLFEGEVDPGDLASFFVDRLVEANKGSLYGFQTGSKVLAALRAVDATPDELAQQGRAVATLFNQEHRGHVNAGAFALFRLRAGDAFVYAMVKFDHQPVGIVDDTTDHARLELVKKTIVESPDAMQKSALVQLDVNGGGELAVRDRRKRKIPDYFVRFLEVERRFTQSELTKKLSDVINDVADDNEAILGARFIQNLPTKIYEAVQGADAFDAAREDIMVSVFGAQPEESPIRQSFAARLAEAGLEHEQFELDKEAVARPTRWRIVTVEGIEVRYPDAVTDRVGERRLDDGSIEIVIRTAEITKHEQLP